MIFKFDVVGRKPTSVRWPDGTTEEMETVVLRTGHGGRSVKVEVGQVVGGREAFERRRRRVHVTIQGFVRAEFVSADDFEASRELISVLKQPGGNKHAMTLGDVPERYRDFKTERYSDRIRQKGAYQSLAVVSREDDLETMASYGLLRWGDREGPDRPASQVAAGRQ